MGRLGTISYMWLGSLQSCEVACCHILMFVGSLSVWTLITARQCSDICQRIPSIHPSRSSQYKDTPPRTCSNLSNLDLSHCTCLSLRQIQCGVQIVRKRAVYIRLKCILATILNSTTCPRFHNCLFKGK